MSSQDYVCNIIDTLSLPRQEALPERSLHTSHHGERLIPFHIYVNPDLSSTNRSVDFSFFIMLPRELQLYILTFCSDDTLFQVMQASSALRNEAKKLFWANPNIYFLVDIRWLLDGSYPGKTSIDTDFLINVENVQIEYDPLTERDIFTSQNQTAGAKQDQVARFWNNFTKTIPRAKKVIITPYWNPPIRRMDTQAISPELRSLIEFAPLNIKTSALIQETVMDDKEDPNAMESFPAKLQRSLYSTSADGKWIYVKSGRNWNLILPPPKQFHGPVGRLNKILYDKIIYKFRYDGLWPQMIESLDRHHFDNESDKTLWCPAMHCEEHFEKAGTWAIHALEAHHYEWYGSYKLEKILPSPLREDFIALMEELRMVKTGIDRAARQIRDEWTKSDPKEQKSAMQDYIKQIKSDKLWQIRESADDSALLSAFRCDMDCVERIVSIM